MQLVSLTYLLFLPAAALLYYVLPIKIRRYGLLAVCLLFYAAGQSQYLWLLALTTVVSYLGGLGIEAAKKKNTDQRSFRTAKWLLAFSLFAVLGLLFFFKYSNFFASAVNDLIKREAIPLHTIAWPLGISFFTFQTVGYLIDVYRETVTAQHNFLTHALFVCFFPQISSGPIGRAKDLMPQLALGNKLLFDHLHQGLLQIGWGFFCKLVIADRISMLTTHVFANFDQYGSGVLLLTVLLFQIQVYCDFSAYSNMAIGSARLFGIQLTRNFNAPFLATSIQDFWSRWHISLSSWLNDYIFTPLTWSRWVNKIFFGSAWDEHKPHIVLNYLIVFFVSGLWHAPSWTFAVWGVLHGVYSILSYWTAKPRTLLLKRLKINRKSFLHKTLSRIYVFFITAFALIFFKLPTLELAFGFIRRLTGFTGTPNNGLQAVFSAGMNEKNFIVVAIALAILLFWDSKGQKKDMLTAVTRQPLLIRWGLYLLLIAAIAVFGIYGPAYDPAPFIYIQF